MDDTTRGTILLVVVEGRKEGRESERADKYGDVINVLKSGGIGRINVRLTKCTITFLFYGPRLGLAN